MTAGCSGADLFMGSFSYINADQVVSTLKAIMNNAQGLLFQAAIEFVSPMISGLMSKFKDLADKFNLGSLNSCEIATSAMGDLTKSASKMGREAAGHLAKNGVTDDWLAFMVDPAVAAGKKPEATEAILTSKTGGNLMWKALVKAKTGDKIAMPMLTVPATPNDVKYINEMLMTFTGTFVSTPENATFDSPLVTAAGDMISFEDFFKGGTFKKFKCDEAVNCTSFDVEDVSFIGAEDYVKVMMYGNKGWLSLTQDALKAKLNDSGIVTVVNSQVSVSGVDPDSISGIIAGASPTHKTLTSEQTLFLNNVGAPIVNLFSQLHGEETKDIKVLAHMLMQSMTYGMVEKMSYSIVRTLKGLEFHKSTNAGGVKIPGNNGFVEFTPEIRARLIELERQSIGIAEKRKEKESEITEAMAFIKGVQERRTKVKNNTYGRG